MRMGAAAVLLTAFLAGCGFLPEEDEPEAPTLPEPPKITRSITYPVERIDLYEQIEGSAYATPVRQTELYFKRSGRVTEIVVRPQDTVEKDQILARQETAELEYQLALGEIDLEIARTYYRTAQLEGSGAVALKIKELELEKQQLRVERLADLIEAAIVRAPYRGTVNRVRIEPGDYVQEYETAVEVSDPTELELQMKVSLDEYERISPGQKALVEVKRDDWRPAVVIQATYQDPRSDAAIRREEYVAHLEIQEELEEPLAPNTRLSCRIILKERADTLAVPLAALREFRERTYVRVLEGDVRREVDVKVGIRTDTKAEILEGLNEGDRVIGK